ncbi:MAG: hypothetical protein FMNOHCHN_03608 [Ignavibacteriaceae bacterium]|nr:hypothetical protein [Ignavibacteriaceae bacterium]GIL17938.1 MAG: hypothetical protein BroJett040_16890 [Oligoflexia bacterium]
MNFLKLSIVIAVMSLTSVWLFADSDRNEKKEKSRREFAPLPEHAAFKTECTSCHQLYHPGLLPERSWKKMMDGLQDHFGENAVLDDNVKAEIEKFLSENSSDRTETRRGKKFLKMIPANESPLRISETAYFKRKHHEIADSTYKRKSIGSAANCLACHPNAEKGYFNEHEVRIPK